MGDRFQTQKVPRRREQAMLLRAAVLVVWGNGAMALATQHFTSGGDVGSRACLTQRRHDRLYISVTVMEPLVLAAFLYFSKLSREPASFTLNSFHSVFCSPQASTHCLYSAGFN